MTWVAIGVGVAGTAISAYGAANASKAAAGQARVSGMAALSEGAMDQASRNQEAKDITYAAAKEADNIKRQAAVMRGSIVVAQSGSGTMIGEGSAQAAIDQLDALSSADALAALYSGVNKASSTRASGRFAGQAGAQKNSASSAAASSLETAASYALIGGGLSAASGLAKGFAGTSQPTKGK